MFDVILSDNLHMCFLIKADEQMNIVQVMILTGYILRGVHGNLNQNLDHFWAMKM